MTAITKLPTRTAVAILEEIENGSYKNWSIAAKALNVDSLECSKLICAKKIANGDLQQCVRQELSDYHQRITKALLLVSDEPIITPYSYREVRYELKNHDEVH